MLHILLASGTLAAAAAVGASAETNPEPAEPASARDLEAQVRSGDLVFRRGLGVASRAVLRSDPDALYSHVGIAIRNGDRVDVVHAVPLNYLEGFIVRETLLEYLAPENATAGAVYRLRQDLSPHIQSLMHVLRGHVERQTPFDDRFDLSDDERLYCTELVWKAFREIGINLFPTLPAPRSTPLGPRTLLFPADLTRHQEVLPVIQYAAPAAKRVGLPNRLARHPFPTFRIVAP